MAVLEAGITHSRYGLLLWEAPIGPRYNQVLLRASKWVPLRVGEGSLLLGSLVIVIGRG